jgi:hypothetical protein
MSGASMLFLALQNCIMTQRIALEQLPVVDLPLEPRAVTPQTASRRMAILLFRGLLVFVGVVIITMTVSKGGLKLPDIECNDIVVGHTPNMMMLMGVGSSHPVYEPKYEIVIRDFHVPLPTALVRIFVQGSRCG